MDPYEFLGVPPEATEEEIEEAYRERAKELHPDVSEREDAREMFLRLQRAYAEATDADAEDLEAGEHIRDGESESEHKPEDEGEGVFEEYGDGWRLCRSEDGGWEVVGEAESSPHVEGSLDLYLDEDGSVSYDRVSFGSREDAERAYRDFSSVGTGVGGENEDTGGRDDGRAGDSTDGETSRGAGSDGDTGGEGDGSEGSDGTSDVGRGEERRGRRPSRGSGSAVWASAGLPSAPDWKPFSWMWRRFRFLSLLVVAPVYIAANATAQAFVGALRSEYSFLILLTYALATVFSLNAGYGVGVSLLAALGVSFLVSVILEFASAASSTY